MTWRPEVSGKFRANVAFKVDGRFPAQVSVVGEAADVGGGGGGGGGGRKGRKRAKGHSAAGDGGKRRSLSQEAAMRGAGPYTSVRAGSLGRPVAGGARDGRWGSFQSRVLQRARSLWGKVFGRVCCRKRVLCCTAGAFDSLWFAAEAGVPRVQQLR